MVKVYPVEREHKPFELEDCKTCKHRIYEKGRYYCSNQRAAIYLQENKKCEVKDER